MQDSPNDHSAQTNPNVVYLSAIRRLKDVEAEDAVYEAEIAAMSKVELLNEMIRYQEERSREGELSLAMMVRGRHLFTALEKNAETREMRLLARSYRRHLECELETFRQRDQA